MPRSRVTIPQAGRHKKSKIIFPQFGPGIVERVWESGRERIFIQGRQKQKRSEDGTVWCGIGRQVLGKCPGVIYSDQKRKKMSGNFRDTHVNIATTGGRGLLVESAGAATGAGGRGIMSRRPEPVNR